MISACHIHVIYMCSMKFFLVIKTYMYKCMATLKYHYIVIYPIVEYVDCFQCFYYYKYNTGNVFEHKGSSSYSPFTLML